jgi:hypothetical protein
MDTLCVLCDVELNFRVLCKLIFILEGLVKKKHITDSTIN